MSKQLWSKIFALIPTLHPRYTLVTRQAPAVRCCFIFTSLCALAPLLPPLRMKKCLWRKAHRDSLGLKWTMLKIKTELSQINIGLPGQFQVRGTNGSVSWLTRGGVITHIRVPGNWFLNATVGACPTPGRYLVKGKGGVLMIDMLGPREPSRFSTCHRMSPVPAATPLSISVPCVVHFQLGLEPVFDIFSSVKEITHILY